MKNFKSFLEETFVPALLEVTSLTIGLLIASQLVLFSVEFYYFISLAIILNSLRFTILDDFSNFLDIHDAFGITNAIFKSKLSCPDR